MKEIQLTRGLVALVDDVDYDWLSRWKWHAQKAGSTWYAARSQWFPEEYRKRKVYMHRVLIEDAGENLVDHRDGNGLNNCRSNLREATRSQNSSHRIRASAKNTSGFRGVCFDKSRGKWQAQLKVDGKFHHVGRFDEITDAAKAYDVAARQWYGEFKGIPNIPEVSA